MIVCPVCDNATGLKDSVRVLIDREGIYATECHCPYCGCVFTICTRVLKPSPLSPDRLKEVHNQPR